MFPEQFAVECEARGENPIDAWFALQDDALSRLLQVAESREDGTVGYSDALPIAEALAGHLGDEEEVKKLAMGTLTYGVGKQFWDIRFFYKDGTEVSIDEVRDQTRWHNEHPDEKWTWGSETTVAWVLKPREG